VNKVRDILKKINIAGSIEFNVPMEEHTSFKTGGPAEAFAVPADYNDISVLLKTCGRFSIPVFVLGAGANILVADKGIRGLVISLASFQKIVVDGTVISAGAGAAMSDVASAAGEASLSGLAFIYGMPGSVGGSVYMNARCYNREIADILHEARVMKSDGTVETLRPDRPAFSYKHSPFQTNKQVILSASFHCEKGDKQALMDEMSRNKEDRRQKGHYRYPSVGSVFKNNRSFGRPTGKIIDNCGLKGYCIGDAQVADFHGNIIINRGNAGAGEILELILFIEEEVRKKTGFSLEREVILVGEWMDKEEP